MNVCYSLNRKFIVNIPSTRPDVVRYHRPWLKGIRYYLLFVALLLNLETLAGFGLFIRLGTGVSFPILTHMIFQVGYL